MAESSEDGSLWNLVMFVASLAVFHLSEFGLALVYNPAQLGWECAPLPLIAAAM